MTESRKKKEARRLKRIEKALRKRIEREEIAKIIRKALDKADGKPEPTILDEIPTPEEVASDDFYK